MKDDGMFPREPAKTTPRERAEEYQRSQDPRYLIEQYRREAASVMAELRAKHDRPELREAMGWPAGVGIALADDDPKREHVVRRWDDLNDVERYAANVEDAMKARQSKTAIVNAVWLGISAHKAFRARPLELEVLRDRGTQGGRAKGGPIAAAQRIANNKVFDAKFAPLYQRRADELMGVGYNYTSAVKAISKEFRRNDDKRHNYARVLSLTKNSFKKPSKSRKR